MFQSIATLVVEFDAPRISTWGTKVTRFVVHQTSRGIMVQYGAGGCDMWDSNTDIADIDRYYSWGIYAPIVWEFANPQTGEFSIWTVEGQLRALDSVIYWGKNSAKEIDHQMDDTEMVNAEIDYEFRNPIGRPRAMAEWTIDPDVPEWELELLY